jgi:hypothetical protein
LEEALISIMLVASGFPGAVLRDNFKDDSIRYASTVLFTGEL